MSDLEKAPVPWIDYVMLFLAAMGCYTIAAAVAKLFVGIWRSLNG